MCVYLTALHSRCADVFSRSVQILQVDCYRPFLYTVAPVRMPRNDLDIFAQVVEFKDQKTRDLAYRAGLYNCIAQALISSSRRQMPKA